MSKIDFLVEQSAEWMTVAGPESDVVVSSRIRLARNVESFPFLLRLEKEDRRELIELLQGAAEKTETLKEACFLQGSELDDLDQQFLVERHLISREHAAEKGEKALVITRNEVVSMMILEEDHLRLQSFQAGFNLNEAWKSINGLDEQLGKNINYSFSQSLGYLTACPTNVGTGIRASCMVHLPSLVLTKQVHKVLQALAKLNLAARGLYGEGTQAIGNFFQFSNQLTLGQTEAEIIENLASVIRQVIEHERDARNYLKSKKKASFEDQIGRAVGILKTARVVSSSEATQLLSLLQLGIHMGLIETGMSQQEVNALFLLIQPAHLQKINHKSLDAAERDIQRACLIRERLKGLSL